MQKIHQRLEEGLARQSEKKDQPDADRPGAEARGPPVSCVPLGGPSSIPSAVRELLAQLKAMVRIREDVFRGGIQ